MKYIIGIAIYLTAVVTFCWVWGRLCRMLDGAPKPQRRPHDAN